jgi:hypothetical protein
LQRDLPPNVAGAHQGVVERDEVLVDQLNARGLPLDVAGLRCLTQDLARRPVSATGA